MTKEKKPFSETKVGKFIHEQIKPIAGDVLEFVGDVTGKEAISRVGQFLNDKVNEGGEKASQLEALQYSFKEKLMEFELELTQIDLEAFRAEVADKANARNHEIEITRITGKRDWIRPTIVILSFVLFITALWLMAYVHVPVENQRVFDMLLGGGVIATMQTAIQYYMGSSMGSKSKDDTLRKYMEKNS